MRYKLIMTSDSPLARWRGQDAALPVKAESAKMNTNAAVWAKPIDTLTKRRASRWRTRKVSDAGNAVSIRAANSYQYGMSKARSIC